MYSRPYLFHSIPPPAAASLWPRSHVAPPGPLLLIAPVPGPWGQPPLHAGVRHLQLRGAPPRAPHGQATLLGPPPAGHPQLGPCRLRRGEERQWRVGSVPSVWRRGAAIASWCSRAPTMSMWPVRTSASPRASNYDFVSINLTYRRVHLPVCAALRGERGGGAQVRAAHRCRLTHHPRRWEHHQGSGGTVRRRRAWIWAWWV
jgi:hypothetical protein